jgi:hypothetical protein
MNTRTFCRRGLVFILVDVCVEGQVKDSVNRGRDREWPSFFSERGRNERMSRGLLLQVLSLKFFKMPTVPFAQSLKQ